MDLLPFSVGAYIISSWISVRSCAKLDTACCSSASREWYLSSVKSSVIFERASLDKAAFRTWCVRRRIKLQQVRIEFDGCVDGDALKTAVVHCCESVRSMSLENIKSLLSRKTLKGFIALLTSVCLKLQELEYSSSDAEPELFIKLAACVPQITSLTVYRCPNLISAHFQEATRHFRQLQHLNILWCGLDDVGLAHILKECATIRTLSCRGHDLRGALAPALVHGKNIQRLVVDHLDHCAVLALAQHCRLLNDLVISTKCDATADAWRALFQSARGLQRLRLTVCDDLRGAELGLSTCLRNVHITHCHQIDDAAVLALANNNPFLSDLYIDSRRLTYALVLPLLCAAPSMRKVYLRNAPRAPLSITTMDRLLEVMVRRQFPHLVEMNFCFV